MIQRILFPAQSLFLILKAVGFQHPCHILGRTCISTFSHRPTLDVHDRCIGIDASHFIRVLCSPVVNNQSATAHALQYGLFMKTILHQIFVKLVPTFYCLIGTIQVGYIAIYHMETLLQQVDVGLWLMSPETSPPYPGSSLCFFSRTYHFVRNPIQLEIVSLITVKIKGGRIFGYNGCRLTLNCIQQVIADFTRHRTRTDRRRMQTVRHNDLIPLVAKQIMQINNTQSIIVSQLFDYQTYLFFDNARTDGVLLGKEATHRSEQNHLRMRIQRAVGIDKRLIFFHKMLFVFPVLRLGVVRSQFNQDNVRKKVFRFAVHPSTDIRIIAVRLRRCSVRTEVADFVIIAQVILQLGGIRVFLPVGNTCTVRDTVAHARHLNDSFCP